MLNQLPLNNKLVVKLTWIFSCLFFWICRSYFYLSFTLFLCNVISKWLSLMFFSCNSNTCCNLQPKKVIFMLIFILILIFDFDFFQSLTAYVVAHSEHKFLIDCTLLFEGNCLRRQLPQVLLREVSIGFCWSATSSIATCYHLLRSLV